MKKGLDFLHYFDTHVHIFPHKIAEKASVNIGKFYDIPMDFDGTVEHCLEIADKGGVEKCLVHSVATTHHQVTSINNFIAESVSEHSDRFIGFCSLHPSMTQNECDEEIKRVIGLGLHGIKLHPDFQEFDIDSPEAMKLYEVIDGRLPILFHTGDCRHGYSSPEKLANAIKHFPKQTVIAAHFGGWMEWDKGEKYLSDFPNVYIDTSSSLYAVPPEKAKQYISSFGVDRVLFGSDYPMWSVVDEIERVAAIDLTDEEREKIYYKNACRLFGVEIND